MSNNLPHNWSFVKLGDVCEINPKLDLTKINDDTEVSFIPMKAVEELSGKIDLSDERKFGKVKKGYTYFGEGDVIFAKITPCMENGKVAITTRLKNGIGFGSTEFHVLRPQNKLLNKFLFNYLIQSSYRKLAQRNMTGTAGQLRVPKRFIENSEIPLPPLFEQKKIVEKIEELFSSLDNGIASLKKAKEQLKLYRQSVLAFAFSGKLTTKVTQNTENLSELSALSGLPEGWKWVSLEKITSKLGDGLHGTPKYSNDGKYFFVNGNNLLDGKIVIKADTKKVNELEFEKYKKPLNDRTVLVSINGTLGKTAFYNGEKIILGKSACYFILKDNISKHYIRYFITSQRFINYANKVATGSTIKNVSLKAMRELEVPLPSNEKIQQQIVSEIEKRFSEADNLEKAIDESLAKSEALRQSILKQAFEGKLV